MPRRTALVAAALAASAVQPAAAAEPARVLRPDRPVFWTGSPFVTEHQLVLRGAGERLRVALDASHMGVDIALARDGETVASSDGIYSAEVLVEDPEPGAWSVRVSTPPRARSRLRAKLERRVPSPPRGTRPLLPDLQLVPPYEFRLLPVGPARDWGCKPYEAVEYRATRCLRFSLGPMNTGEGPLSLVFPARSGYVTEEPVYQRVLHADGRTSLRPAGTALLHATHAHHHHQGFGSLELWKVLDPRRGRLARDGGGPKQGFCMEDYLIAEWRAFRNAPAGSTRQDCVLVPRLEQDTELGLSTGWADIYGWFLDGNYVEPADGVLEPGRYLVRSTADADDEVLETNERNNTSYAYIEISGTTVRVLERGHGQGPWDRSKRLAADLLPPLA